MENKYGLELPGEEISLIQHSLELWIGEFWEFEVRNNIKQDEKCIKIEKLLTKLDFRNE